MYINELPQLLENNTVDPFILPNGDKLSSLLYADDLIILSQSPSGLQNGLNILSQFCSKWGLTVNLKKTQIMVFQKKNKRNKLSFIYENHPVEAVSHCTYLAIKSSASGDLKTGIEVLSSKARNALAALRKNITLEKLPVHIANQLFESFCVPGLTYGSEVWGLHFKR